MKSKFAAITGTIVIICTVSAFLGNAYLKAEAKKIDEYKAISDIKLILQHNNLAEFYEDSTVGFYGLMADKTLYTYDKETREQTITTPTIEVAKQVIVNLHDMNINYSMNPYEEKDINSDTVHIKYRIQWRGMPYLPQTDYNYNSITFNN